MEKYIKFIDKTYFKLNLMRILIYDRRTYTNSSISRKISAYLYRYRTDWSQWFYPTSLSKKNERTMVAHARGQHARYPGPRGEPNSAATVRRTRYKKIVSTQ